MEEYINTKKKNGVVAISLRDGDSLASVCLVKDEPMMLVTKNGMGIKFNSTDVGATSRATVGVRGITILENDEVISAIPIRCADDELAIFSSTGLGKKFSSSELPLQKRGGKGLICYKPSTSTGDISAAVLVSNEDSLLVCGDKSSICISAKEIPSLSRASLGNQIIKNNTLLSVSKV